MKNKDKKILKEYSYDYSNSFISNPNNTNNGTNGAVNKKTNSFYGGVEQLCDQFQNAYRNTYEDLQSGSDITADYSQMRSLNTNLAKELNRVQGNMSNADMRYWWSQYRQQLRYIKDVANKAKMNQNKSQSNGGNASVNSQNGFVEIPFDLGKYTISNIAYSRLQQLAKIIGNNTPVTLAAGTDNLGDPTKNEQLKQLRVNAVKSAMARLGMTQANNAQIVNNMPYIGAQYNNIKGNAQIQQQQRSVFVVYNKNANSQNVNAKYNNNMALSGGYNGIQSNNQNQYNGVNNYNVDQNNTYGSDGYGIPDTYVKSVGSTTDSEDGGVTYFVMSVKMGMQFRAHILNNTVTIGPDGGGGSRNPGDGREEINYNAYPIVNEILAAINKYDQDHRIPYKDFSKYQVNTVQAPEYTGQCDVNYPIRTDLGRRMFNGGYEYDPNLIQ